MPPPPPPEPSAEPAWQRYAVKVNIDPKSPKIALLIDDMGVDLKHSREILDLPAPLTLAYLPYSHGLTRQSTQAHIRGHELMLHLPMQPLSADEYPGPRALLVSQSDEEIRQNLLFNLDRLSGYTGVNNHMGSRFTADARRMRLVLEILKQRGLFFLDSRTNGKSQAEKVAAELGMPHLGRDVFVDDDDTPEAIARQLRTMEKIAKKHGQVIGIAHPRRATVSALREWIPKMQAQGFAFVPISYIVARKERVAPSRPEITGAGVPDIPAR
ncbi:MAG: divergent polysaccharide deacetylase family protein [Dongiaceae bacterium]